MPRPTRTRLHVPCDGYGLGSLGLGLAVDSWLLVVDLTAVPRRMAGMACIDMPKYKSRSRRCACGIRLGACTGDYCEFTYMCWPVWRWSGSKKIRFVLSDTFELPACSSCEHYSAPNPASRLTAVSLLPKIEALRKLNWSDQKPSC
jgi:hypothetical protein